ncbi:MAG: glycosyltransferase [Actinomycetota bacterium]
MSSLRLTIVIPIMNQLRDIIGILGLLKTVTSPEVEWLIIDNNSTDPVEKTFREYIKPKKLNYVRNKENLGLVKTYQQIYELCETDVLAIIHNDVYIYEQYWDRRILSYFEQMKDLGMAGFFGAQGCLPNGGRLQMSERADQAAGLSNMIEAEIHGMRMKEEWKPVAIFDGFALIFRMEMLKKNNGIDQNYQYFHLYDRELGLASLRLGYKNIVVNVPCHHVSGVTAVRPEYQEWINKKMGVEKDGDLLTHDRNTEIFKNKWGDVLPLYVNDDFSFRSGEVWPGSGFFYKSDKIVNFKNES